ncbi:MAG: calcium-binding EF-hand-containing protein [Sphingomonas bacterium]|nr:calcium-binding EF-hand-containing protein [Sphingomonas bacterium]
MKTFLIGAGVVALVAVPALALQQGGPPDRAGRGAAMTRTQVQDKVQQGFAKVDANRDGSVTKAELDAHGAAMKQARQADRAERRGQMFTMLDSDKNGQLSEAEFLAPHPRGEGDGMERRGGREGHEGHGMKGKRMGMRGHGGGMAGLGRMGEGWLAMADANKDGKVTLAEASARPLAMFDRVDANKDGTVTPDERRAARGMMREAWKAPRG